MKKLFAASLILLTSCSLVPEYKNPVTETPKTWTQPVDSKAAEVTAEWWKKYNSAELDRLVTDALCGKIQN